MLFMFLTRCTRGRWSNQILQSEWAITANKFPHYARDARIYCVGLLFANSENTCIVCQSFAIFPISATTYLKTLVTHNLY